MSFNVCSVCRACEGEENPDMSYCKRHLLTSAMERVRALTDPKLEPKPACIIVNPDADWHEDYCDDCAYILVAFFQGKTERPEKVWEDESIPDWAGAEEVYVDGGWGYESEGSRFCGRCSCMLDIGLIGCGPKEEIDHYEAHGPDTNWWIFLQMLEGVDETDDVPLKLRALALVEKYVPCN